MIFPSSLVSIPPQIFKTVDFPAPDEPKMITCFPFFNFKVNIFVGDDFCFSNLIRLKAVLYFNINRILLQFSSTILLFLFKQTKLNEQHVD